jgi:hypothetical protein
MMTEMKKQTIFFGLLMLGLIVSNSCSKDFLEVDPKGTTLETNYYKNADEALAGLIAAYDPLGFEVVKDYSSKVGLLNTASDDLYAVEEPMPTRATWEAGIPIPSIPPLVHG